MYYQSHDTPTVFLIPGYFVLLTPDSPTNINTKPQNCDPKAPIGGGVPPDGNEKSKHAQT